MTVKTTKQERRSLQREASMNGVPFQPEVKETLSDVEKVAKRVIDIYPSIEELSNHEHIVKIYKNWDLSKISNKVFVVSGAVDEICKTMYGLGFWKSTFFSAEADPHDLNTGKNIGGEALIYDANKQTYKVGYLEFIALTKVMICSFLEIPLTDKQYEVYLDFKCIPHIYHILD